MIFKASGNSHERLTPPYPPLKGEGKNLPPLLGEGGGEVS